MKKFIVSLFLFLSLFTAPLVFAIDVEQGAKLSAPNLVKLSNSWFLGAEVKKELRQTNSDEGYGAYVKLTYTGSILDFSKK